MREGWKDGAPWRCYSSDHYTTPPSKSCIKTIPLVYFWFLGAELVPLLQLHVQALVGAAVHLGDGG